MKRIKFLIVGMGNIGTRHAQHIIDNPQAELVGICDTNPMRTEHYGKNISVFEDVKEMLKHTDADVLNVCTPNYLHERHTVLGLEHSVHTVVEKPMAMTTKECDNMIGAALKHGKKIFAVKQNRYNEPVSIVKRLIEENKLGKVYFIQVNCFWNRSDEYYAQSEWRGKKAKDGGCLFTQFSHFVDILYYLNGTIHDVQGNINNYAHGHNTEIEDTGSFVMKATNGAMVNFNFSTCTHKKNMEGAITIIAEKGTIKIGGQYLNTVEYQSLEDGEVEWINISAKENDYGLYKGSMSNHDKVIENVVNVLLHNGSIMTGAEEGREVIKIIEHMYKNATIL